MLQNTSNGSNNSADGSGNVVGDFDLPLVGDLDFLWVDGGDLPLVGDFEADAGNLLFVGDFDLPLVGDFDDDSDNLPSDDNPLLCLGGVVDLVSGFTIYLYNKKWI